MKATKRAKAPATAVPLKTISLNDDQARALKEMCARIVLAFMDDDIEKPEKQLANLQFCSDRLTEILKKLIHDSDHLPIIIELTEGQTSAFLHTGSHACWGLYTAEENEDPIEEAKLQHFHDTLASILYQLVDDPTEIFWHAMAAEVGEESIAKAKIDVTSFLDNPENAMVERGILFSFRDP